MNDLRAEGGCWVRIGNQVLISAEKSSCAAVGTRLGVLGIDVQWRTERFNRKHLWLVVQKGLLFQQAHPDVPVLLDGGRYLIVHLRNSEREAVAPSSEPCFALFPLRWNTEITTSKSRSMFREARIDWIQNLVDGVSQSDIEAHVSHLAGMPTRHSTSAHYLAAADWCRNLLAGFGYQARTDDIQVLGSLSRNVIAEKQATGTDPRPMIMVAAHLDSINTAGGANAPAPGADDNASGSSALLVLAQQLSSMTVTCDIRFVLFGGEEQGLLGSGQYVAMLSPEERSRISSVINMDMIARLNALPTSVLLEGSAGSQRVMDALATAAATYTSLNVTMSTMPFGSDHVSFINAGIPAVLTIEGSDTSNTLIHTENDTPSELNFDLALEILRMNLAYLSQTLSIGPRSEHKWLEPMLHVMMS